MEQTQQDVDFVPETLSSEEFKAITQSPDDFVQFHQEFQREMGQEPPITPSEKHTPKQDDPTTSRSNGDGTPKKYLNKFDTEEELVSAYQALEKEKSRLGNEYGNLRKLMQTEQTPYGATQPPPVDRPVGQLSLDQYQIERAVSVTLANNPQVRDIMENNRIMVWNPETESYEPKVLTKVPESPDEWDVLKKTDWRTYNDLMSIKEEIRNGLVKGVEELNRMQSTQEETVDMTLGTDVLDLENDFAQYGLPELDDSQLREDRAEFTHLKNDTRFWRCVNPDIARTHPHLAVYHPVPGAFKYFVETKHRGDILDAIATRKISEEKQRLEKEYTRRSRDQADFEPSLSKAVGKRQPQESILPPIQEWVSPEFQDRLAQDPVAAQRYETLIRQLRDPELQQRYLHGIL